MGQDFNGRWNTVVRTRGGVKVVYWPGVIACAALVAVTIGGSLGLGWAYGGPALRYALTFMAGLNTGLLGFGVAHRVRRELQIPPDRSGCLDDLP